MMDDSERERERHPRFTCGERVGVSVPRNPSEGSSLIDVQCCRALVLIFSVRMLNVGEWCDDDPGDCASDTVADSTMTLIRASHSSFLRISF